MWQGGHDALFDLLSGAVLRVLVPVLQAGRRPPLVATYSPKVLGGARRLVGKMPVGRWVFAVPVANLVALVGVRADGGMGAIQAMYDACVSQVTG